MKEDFKTPSRAVSEKRTPSKINDPFSQKSSSRTVSHNKTPSKINEPFSQKINDPFSQKINDPFSPTLKSTPIKNPCGQEKYFDPLEEILNRYFPFYQPNSNYAFYTRILTELSMVFHECSVEEKLKDIFKELFAEINKFLDLEFPGYRHRISLLNVLKDKDEFLFDVFDDYLIWKKKDFTQRKDIELEPELEQNVQPFCVPATAESSETLLLKTRNMLKPYQIGGLKFMLKCILSGHGCILAHAMGLGKTLQVISMLHTLQFKKAKILILCPATLSKNWIDEFYKWIMIDEITRVFGKIYDFSECLTKDAKFNAVNSWSRDGGVMIVSYSKLRDSTRSEDRHFFHYFLNPGPDIIIADEGHLIKNKNSILTSQLQHAKTKIRICLTGYPLQNNLMEYWCMVNFTKPGWLKDHYCFKHEFIKPIEEGVFIESSINQQKVSQAKLFLLDRLISSFVTREDSSHLTKIIPKKTEFLIFCPISHEQKVLYNSTLKLLVKFNVSFFERIYILQSIINHPAILKELFLNDESPSSLNSSLKKKIFNELKPQLEQINNSFSSIKLTFLSKLLKTFKDIGDKVIVFSRSIHSLSNILFHSKIDKIEEIMKEMEGYVYYRIDGSTDVHIRQDMIHTFNSSKSADAFLFSSLTGSLGINTYSANRVILFDIGWNPSHDEQAIARAYRLGQTKPVFVYRLVGAESIEERLLEINAYKSSIALRVMDGVNAINTVSKRLMKSYFRHFDLSKHEISNGKWEYPSIMRHCDKDFYEAFIKYTCSSILISFGNDKIKVLEYDPKVNVTNSVSLTDEEKSQLEKDAQKEIAIRRRAIEIYEREISSEKSSDLIDIVDADEEISEEDDHLPLLDL
ncbi:hypothetical protein ROZALSC1DRAFT_31203 [Rozella allomycis CSF55]|uniref:SNF2-related domain-containing protein n=1 Tax=Rozella allomycis (strain CSF55) TaxID=988480 RepID=A0A4P9YCW3_ROZAC|nr:hypothetical protein ROZALSC1DRAFT_31203 [Rozella allomycis CSF55]